jgi:hypothetical protein
MRKFFGIAALSAVSAAVMLAGCATSEEVAMAQASANRAQATADAAHSAALTADQKADQAGQLAQRANAEAGQAQAAANSANTAAQSQSQNASGAKACRRHTQTAYVDAHPGPRIARRGERD